MKTILCAALLFGSFTVHANPLVDIGQCMGYLSFDVLEDQPSADTKEKILKMHRLIRQTNPSGEDLGELSDRANVFTKALSYTSQLDDPTAFEKVKSDGQNSCARALK